MAGRKPNGQQLPWREDPEIIARMQEVAELRAAGNSLPMVARKLGLAVSTVYEHWDRWLELVRERAESKAGEHVVQLEALKARIVRELDDAGRQSLNRSALIAQLRQVEMDIAKLDGSLVERKEVSGELTLRDLVADLAKDG